MLGAKARKVLRCVRYVIWQTPRVLFRSAIIYERGLLDFHTLAQKYSYMILYIFSMKIVGADQ